MQEVWLNLVTPEDFRTAARLRHGGEWAELVDMPKGIIL